MTASYQLTGRFELGDLADLFKATQMGGGDVVVKLFHPKTSDPAYARVLAETSRVLNPLRQPGIVRYVEIGFVDQRLAVVREHVDGYTLGTVLRRLNTKEVLLPSALALYLVTQLAEMVQQAHEAGVIHGAITPGNLLLSREGAPSICDFGALNALMAVPELKRAFATRGRSAYRAPEVGRGDGPSTVSDVYSLGAIAYELLTLREAIVATGNLSTRSGGLPPPSRVDRRINSRLDPIILRALEPLPNRRFRSAGDFASALRNFFAAQGGMPGQEDLRRFVRELVPNEVNLSILGPVPFSEPFKLAPISGAEIAHVRAERLEVSVVARNPFSPALSAEESREVPGQEETKEAPPPFEEFKPEEWAPKDAAPPQTEPTQDVTPVDQAPPDPSVDEVEDTDPSRGWEAPPGVASPKPPKAPNPQGREGSGREGTHADRNPRLKWVEDFAEQHTAGDDDDEVDTDSIRTQPKERPEIPMPPPTDEHVAIGSDGRRLLTEERNLLAMARQRQRALWVALAIATVGIFSFSIAVWQLIPSSPGTQQPPPKAPARQADPRESAVSGAVNQYGMRPQQQPKPPAATVSDGREDAAETPPPDANSAFITLRTNIPARVLIDGEPIGKRAPLTKYPVKPGTRSIILEAQGSKERVEFNLRLERGQHRIVDQKFESPPRR